jgi:cytochrome c-type biogenesis protein CcmH
MGSFALAALVLGLALPPADQPVSLDPARERQARQLEAALIAPCCWTQQVSVHQSPAADALRRDIRRQLAAGLTPRQILDGYVAQYGERILAEPPARGFSRMLYVLPVVLLVLSAAGLAGLVRPVARRTGPALPPELERPDAAASEYRARLDAELRDLD